jgi:DNA polymerase-1
MTTLDVVRPAAVGTHRFTARIDAAYTAGRDFVGEALERMLRRSGIVSMDIETFGLGTDARKLKSVSFGLHNWAIVLDPRDPVQYALIQNTIEDAERLVTHGGVFDVVNLHLNGLLQTRHIDKIVDTIIYSRFAEPSDIGGHDLFKAGKKYAGLEGDNYLKAAFKALGMAAENGWRAFDIDRPIYLQGAAADVIVTARIYPALIEAAYRQTTQDHPFANHGVSGQEALDLIEREQIVNRVLLRRACKGVVVDLEYLNVYEEQTREVREEAEAELERLGIEPSNSDDLIRWMVDHNELPPLYPRVGKTQKLSAQAKHVETIQHPVAKLFVRHKKIVKIEKDYLLKCKDLAIRGADGHYRVNPLTNVMKAATGRAAMSEPPLHQFNGPARGVLVADPGDELVSIDWSAIEPILVANLAGERAMYEHYETFFPGKARLSGPDKGKVTWDERGGAEGDWGDAYESVAEMAGIDRKPAKIVLLAQLYGEGITKLSVDLATSEGSARELRDNIFSQIPSVAEFVRTLRDQAKRYQKIMTVSGRIIPVPSGFYDGNYSVQAHKGVNYTVQGSAYDILAETVATAYREGIADGIYWTMHDELICSRDIARRLQKIMETPPDRLCRLSGRTPMLRTDLTVMGERWIEA